jgi:nicotinamide mononucleotide (NMN) deamidase PncC
MGLTEKMEVLFVAACQKEGKTLLTAEGVTCGCVPEGTEDAAGSGRRYLWVDARRNRRRRMELKTLFVAACQKEQKTLLVAEDATCGYMPEETEDAAGS